MSLNEESRATTIVLPQIHGDFHASPVLIFICPDRRIGNVMGIDHLGDDIYVGRNMKSQLQSRLGMCEPSKGTTTE